MNPDYKAMLDEIDAGIKVIERNGFIVHPDDYKAGMNLARAIVSRHAEAPEPDREKLRALFNDCDWQDLCRTECANWNQSADYCMGKPGVKCLQADAILGSRPGRSTESCPARDASPCRPRTATDGHNRQGRG
jgi:hypothetical protein